MRRSQGGEGKIGCVFWGLITMVVVLVAVKVVPIKIATMKLEDHMKDMAMTKPRRSKEFFERSIVNRALELELEIPRKQIRVKKFPERVIMDVEFTVPVEVIGFEYDWNIKLHVDRDLFLI